MYIYILKNNKMNSCIVTTQFKKRILPEKPITGKDSQPHIDKRFNLPEIYYNYKIICI